MKMDSSFGGVVPALSGNEILTMTSNIYELADIEVHEFAKLPGPHMTPRTHA